MTMINYKKAPPKKEKPLLAALLAYGRLRRPKKPLYNRPQKYLSPSSDI